MPAAGIHLKKGSLVQILSIKNSHKIHVATAIKNCEWPFNVPYVAIKCAYGPYVKTISFPNVRPVCFATFTAYVHDGSKAGPRAISGKGKARPINTMIIALRAILSDMLFDGTSCKSYQLFGVSRLIRY
jgi:hypothetical protein